MENADYQPNIGKIEIRVLQLLAGAEKEGLTRSQLLQGAHVKVSVLEPLLATLMQAERIVGRQDHRSQWGLGRPAWRYWHKDFAPTLTLPEAGDIRTSDPAGEAAPPKGTCKQCGSAIVANGPGRPPEVCSEACRRLFASGGITVADFMARAATPPAFAQAAVLLVAMDLILRGLHVASPWLRGGPQLMVSDGTNALLLTVVPVGADGYFPNPLDYESMAAVFKDGRIQYGGQHPLVEPEAPAEAKSPSES